MKTDAKLLEALTLLMEAYSELQKSVESDFGTTDLEDIDENHDLQVEIDAAIVTELRTTIETVIDTEDFAPEEIASALSSMSEALEEIDPNVFASDEDDDVEEYDEVDDDLDELDDLDDIDDLDDLDEYDEDDDEEDDDEEDDDDDDED